MSDEAPRPPGADPAPSVARKREIPWGLILGAIALAGAAAPFALPRLRRALSHRPPSGRTAPMLISGRCPAGMAEIPGATARPIFVAPRPVATVTKTVWIDAGTGDDRVENGQSASPARSPHARRRASW